MRKFNLEMFKEYLNQEIRNHQMKRSTAEDYVRKLGKLNDSLPEEDYSCKELAERIDYLCGLSATTQARKYINAVKKYEKGVLQSPGVCLYGEPLSALYRKYPAAGVVEIQHETEQYARKINGLSREQLKMKIALRLQLKSGLRVSELSSLTAADLNFAEGKLKVHVRNGKGGKERTVTALPDAWLNEQLKDYLLQNPKGRLFDEKREIERFAKKLDIKTHELRKVYARLLYRDLRESGYTMAQARREVGRQLGHEGERAGNITNLYLGKEWEYGKKGKRETGNG